jgi:putative transcriptional regulator
MQANPTPLANRLLIALPALADPQFARSVALVCQHDEEGAMGVLVNRPSEYTLGDVFQQMGIDSEDESLRGQIVLSGGPVHPERGFVLHDGGDGWDSTLAVSDRLYVTTSRDILEAMASGAGPAHAVVALGCAGWGAGQLEQELTEDTVAQRAGRYRPVFETPIDARWQAPRAGIGVDLTQVADYSGKRDGPRP